MRAQRTFLRFASIAVFFAGLGAWWAGCNDHPVEYTPVDSDPENIVDIFGGDTEMDLLWVLDNSGSMCEEQTTLRNEFDRFITKLRETPVDFNMAVTTTSFGGAVERVAKGGEIQSTPHPPAGFGDNCNEPDKIKQQVNDAVACAKESTDVSDLVDPTDDEIECALNQTQAACDRAGPEWDTDAATADLFPCEDADGDGTACNSYEDFDAAYRDIPKVLEADAYEDGDESLNVDELKRDFACMSYVGTRGDAFEQGLRAAVEAVSPEKTGGTVENPLDEHGGTSAPNHVFLRDDAKTAVIFVTDENDCSRPESTDFPDNGCDQMNCYFAAAEGRDDQDPLFDTDELADRFMSNLADSKGIEEVDQSDVVMASIHGNYKPYGTRDGQRVVDACHGTEQQTLRANAKVCERDELGTATSGDRYEDFLQNFDEIFPERPENRGHLKGWMCDPNLGNGLEQLGESLRPNRRGCVRDRVTSCNTGADCPDYRWGPSRDGEICQQWGSAADGNFCASTIQVRLKVREEIENDPADLLETSGLCYDDSIGAERLARRCVVDREAYTWTGCGGDPTGAIELEWDPSRVANPGRELSSFDVEIRYTGGDNHDTPGETSMQ